MAGIFAFVAIASLGLPGLAGFSGEFMSLLSSFSPRGRPRRRAVPGVHGRSAASARSSRRVTSCGCCSGSTRARLPVRWKEHGFRDILAVEWVSWVPLLALIARARAWFRA